ncbi:MAG: isocyanide synthase family protein [Renibacterium sp.]|nr:isocyanide synthase family protein [Renibacterium sp.]
MSAAATVRSPAHRILDLLLPFRRATEANRSGRPEDFPQILEALERVAGTEHRLRFALPGFPCKSPNPAKVLGALPDAGERASLQFLDALCARMEAEHPAGVRLAICSDGHIFADAIGVDQEAIDAYFEDLRQTARAEGLQHLEFFSLRDRYPGRMDHSRRQSIIEHYGPSLEELRQQVRADPALASLYRGIIRFLVEDSVGHQGTRSALQRDCRRRAYQVLQRSIAWGGIVAEQFPDAVRLSIHPQPGDSEKFGLRLLESDSPWTTPWHSAPLKLADGSLKLIRRDEVPANARLRLRNGRADHFELGEPR